MNSNKSFEAESDQASHIILLQQKYIYFFYLGKISNSTYSWLSVSKGFGSRAPVDTKIYRWPSPLYKMAQNLHITYTHTPIYFKSSLKVKVKSLSLMGLFATPCTVAHQQVESKDFRTLEYITRLHDHSKQHCNCFGFLQYLFFVQLISSLDISYILCLGLVML